MSQYLCKISQCTEQFHPLRFLKILHFHMNKAFYGHLKEIHIPFSMNDTLHTARFTRTCKECSVSVRGMMILDIV